jgi:hypothetical protein
MKQKMARVMVDQTLPWAEQVWADQTFPWVDVVVVDLKLLMAQGVGEVQTLLMVKGGEED